MREEASRSTPAYCTVVHGSYHSRGIVLNLFEHGLKNKNEGGGRITKNEGLKRLWYVQYLGK
jgi:hypothetical protein